MVEPDMRQLALLCALADTQNLTRAAARMHMSVSAASQSLAKLQSGFPDKLIERTANRYQLTATGRSVIEPLRDMLALWQGLDTRPQSVSAARLEGAVVLATHDALAELDVVELRALLQRQAPRLQLHLTQATHSRTDVYDLRAGSIDLLCTHMQPPVEASDLHSSLLGEAPLSHCCLRRDHPRIGDHLSLAQYLAEEHVVTLHHSRMTEDVSPVDRFLGEQGLGPRRVIRVQSGMVMVRLMLEQNALQTGSAARARAMSQLSPEIKSLPLPAPLDGLMRPLRLVWHHRTHHSDVHRWLREQVRSCVSAVLDQTLP